MGVQSLSHTLQQIPFSLSLNDLEAFSSRIFTIWYFSSHQMISLVVRSSWLPGEDDNIFIYRRVTLFGGVTLIFSNFCWRIPIKIELSDNPLFSNNTLTDIFYQKLKNSPEIPLLILCQLGEGGSWKYQGDFLGLKK